MKNQGEIIVISGPSGVGKDTIIERVLSLSSFQRFAAYTTRPMRSGEVNGVDYRFVTHEQFAKLRNSYEFLDCTELSGNLYGTPIHDFEQVMKKGLKVIIHLKAASALLLQRRIPFAKIIFILPPFRSELERRLRVRGETEESIALRMNEVEEEVQKVMLFDYIIVNYKDEVDDVAKRIIQFID